MRWNFVSAIMNVASLGFWPFIRRKNFFIVWISVVLFTSDIHQINGEPNKSFQMKTLCKAHFLQMVYRKTDGAVLWSQNERNLDCALTFQTHSILQRFLVRFDALQLDCNDHLYIYDGAHATGAPKMDISCRNTKQSVGNIITQSNFLTLKYMTDGWGTDSNGFKLVLTAIKNINHACKEFRCKSTEFCISADLMCDGINHCGDGTDEAPHSPCPNVEAKTIFGLEMTWLVLLAVSAFLLLSGCFVGIAIWFCRLRTSTSDNNNLQLNNHHCNTNGSSKTTTINRTTSDTMTYSGNMQHPA
ncbi:uncharacterized protein LOC129564792, partial [Sitodiplosis mosellana]|uniref:uncharacterized protein LOC129564792 n=1 Tax=Sitodiplosis mosellana TaxID=263140 RepID=UPI00244509CA